MYVYVTIISKSAVAISWFLCVLDVQFPFQINNLYISFYIIMKDKYLPKKQDFFFLIIF